MGLDGVELIMAVEEKFGIEIIDAEASETLTPAELIELVLTKVKTTTQSACFSQKAFHLLRRAAMGRYRVRRKDFRPGTELEQFIPTENRLHEWQVFSKEIGATKWPDLQRPKWIVSVLGLATLCTCALAFLALRGGWSFLVAAAASTLVIWIGTEITEPFKQEFSSQYANVGHLSEYLVAFNSQLFVSNDGDNNWTRERVRLTVREIIKDQLSLDDFNDDDSFVKDLNLD